MAEDLNSTSIPSGGDALKEALDVMGQAVQQAADWFYEYEALHEAKGTPDALAKAATNANRAEWLHHMKDKAESVSPADGGAREALSNLLAMFDAYLDSDLSHADAHACLVRYPVWEAARLALHPSSRGEAEQK